MHSSALRFGLASPCVAGWQEGLRGLLRRVWLRVRLLHVASNGLPGEFACGLFGVQDIDGVRHEAFGARGDKADVAPGTSAANGGLICGLHEAMEAIAGRAVKRAAWRPEQGPVRTLAIFFEGGGELLITSFEGGLIWNFNAGKNGGGLAARRTISGGIGATVARHFFRGMKP